jgi:EAL domain
MPVYRHDGSLYGLLCALRRPGSTPTPGDGRFLALLAHLIEDTVAELDAAQFEHDHQRLRIRTVIDDGPEIALQPIVTTTTGVIVGYEALARFPGVQGPLAWFDEAATVGLQTDLELSAAARALPTLAHLPDDAYLAVNLSPNVITDGRFARLLAPFPADRLVIEVTERAPSPTSTSSSPPSRTSARWACASPSTTSASATPGSSASCASSPTSSSSTTSSPTTSTATRPGWPW